MIKTNLKNSTLKKFADLLNVGKPEKTSKTYGTINIKNGTCAVLVDGATEPIVISNEEGYNTGDRVEINVTDKNLVSVTPVSVGAAGGKMVMFGGGGTNITNIANKQNIDSDIEKFVREHPELFNGSGSGSGDNDDSDITARYLKAINGTKFQMQQIDNTNEYELKVAGQAGTAKIHHSTTSDTATDSENADYVCVKEGDTFSKQSRVDFEYNSLEDAIVLTHKAMSKKDILVDRAEYADESEKSRYLESGDGVKWQMVKVGNTNQYELKVAGQAGTASIAYSKESGSADVSERSKYLEVKDNSTGEFSSQSTVIAEAKNGVITLKNNAQSPAHIRVNEADSAGTSDFATTSNYIGVKNGDTFSNQNTVIAELKDGNITLKNNAQSKAPIKVDKADIAYEVDWDNITNKPSSFSVSWEDVAPAWMNNGWSSWNDVKNDIKTVEVNSAVYAGEAGNAETADYADESENATYMKVKVDGVPQAQNRISAEWRANTNLIKLVNNTMGAKKIGVDWADESLTADTSLYTKYMEVKSGDTFSSQSTVIAEAKNGYIELKNNAQSKLPVKVSYSDTSANSDNTSYLKVKVDGVPQEQNRISAEWRPADNIIKLVNNTMGARDIGVDFAIKALESEYAESSDFLRVKNGDTFSTQSSIIADYSNGVITLKNNAQAKAPVKVDSSDEATKIVSGSNQVSLQYISGNIVLSGKHKNSDGTSSTVPVLSGNVATDTEWADVAPAWMTNDWETWNDAMSDIKLVEVYNAQYATNAGSADTATNATTAEQGDFLRVKVNNAFQNQNRISAEYRSTDQMVHLINNTNGAKDIAVDYADYAYDSTHSDDSMYMKVKVNDEFQNQNRISAEYKSDLNAIKLINNTQGPKPIYVDHSTASDTSEFATLSNYIGVKSGDTFSNQNTVIAEAKNGVITLKNNAQSPAKVTVDKATVATKIDSGSNQVELQYTGGSIVLVGKHVNGSGVESTVPVLSGNESSVTSWSDVAPAWMNNKWTSWNDAKNDIKTVEVNSAVYAATAGSAGTATTAGSADSATTSNYLQVKEGSSFSTQSSVIAQYDSNYDLVRLKHNAQSTKDVGVNYADEAGTASSSDSAKKLTSGSNSIEMQYINSSIVLSGKHGTTSTPIAVSKATTADSATTAGSADSATNSQYMCVRENSVFSNQSTVIAEYDSTSNKVKLKHNAQSKKDISVNYAESAGSVAWDNVTSKPTWSTFAQSWMANKWASWNDFTSDVKIVTVNNASNATNASYVPWSGVTNKPFKNDVVFTTGTISNNASSDISFSISDLDPVDGKIAGHCYEITFFITDNTRGAMRPCKVLLTVPNNHAGGGSWHKEYVSVIYEGTYSGSGVGWIKFNDLCVWNASDGWPNYVIFGLQINNYTGQSDFFNVRASIQKLY